LRMMNIIIATIINDFTAYGSALTDFSVSWSYTLFVGPLGRGIGTVTHTDISTSSGIGT
jgi:hypothetical protein